MNELINGEVIKAVKQMSRVSLFDLQLKVTIYRIKVVRLQRKIAGIDVNSAHSVTL